MRRSRSNRRRRARQRRKARKNRPGMYGWIQVFGWSRMDTYEMRGIDEPWPLLDRREWRSP